MKFPRNCKPWALLNPQRARLSQPYLDTRAKRLVCCDGSSLASLPVHLDPEDETGYVPAYMLKEAVKDAQLDEERFAALDCNPNIRRGLDLGDFPNWRGVMDEYLARPVLASAAVDLTKLNAIASVFGTRHVELLVRGILDAVEVRPLSCRDDIAEGKGMLMPLRLQGAEERGNPQAAVPRWQGRRLLGAT